MVYKCIKGERKMSELNLEKRYEIDIGLYKHFNQLILSALGFIYTLISGLMTFYFVYKAEESAKYILIVCICILVIFFILSFFSIYLLNSLNDELKEISQELKLARYPSIKPIKYFLFSNDFISVMAIVILVKLFI